MTTEELQEFYDRHSDELVILRRWDIETDITLHDFIKLVRNVLISGKE